MNIGLQTQAKTRSTETPSYTPVHTGLLQRKCACGQHTTAGRQCGAYHNKWLKLQRRATSETEPKSVPPIVYEVLRSPGQPLDSATRAFMEPRFGHDFSQVRVHTDAKAAESAQAINALAYTVGQVVVFGERKYAAETMEGKRLIAHELTHVVQQGGSENKRASALRMGEGDSPQKREAAHVSRQVVSGPVAGGNNAISTLSASPGLIQRESAWDWFKREVLDEYQVDITVISPWEAPVVGRPRIGARRNRDGTWTLVVGNERKTVGADEIDDILGGLGRLRRGEERTAPSGPTPFVEPFEPTVFVCPPGEYYDFIRLGCLPEISLPTPAGLPNYTLYFFYDSTLMRPESNDDFQLVVELLQKVPSPHVQLTGHTSLEGTEAYNQRLSEQRVEAVRDRLVTAGIDATRILTLGMGEFAPAVTEPAIAGRSLLPSVESVRALNRRVEVAFFDPSGRFEPRFPPFTLRTPGPAPSPFSLGVPELRLGR